MKWLRKAPPPTLTKTENKGSEPQHTYTYNVTLRGNLYLPEPAGSTLSGKAVLETFTEGV